eukprot:TRINITY_DN296_c0_g1_i2.p1 TRINITY_DN296_c0_g1~~TRINITY_DN296_c0_g1_i2.p1  ORF type:complete len:121 (+),score=3.21 TRINITY_DN296_c0_g1_i2:209-571(+)
MQNGDTPPVLGYYYIPAIVGTLALIMINLVNLESLNPTSWAFDENVETKVKVWLFFSAMLAFCSLGGGLWIAIQVYLSPHNSGSQYPGYALMGQNFIILMSGMMFLWIRSERSKESYQSL